MKTLEYLEKVKAKKGITSTYGLAKALGVSRSAVTQWERGICGFNDDTAKKVAEILGMHPGLVMIDNQREHAKNEETKRYWNEIFEGFPSPSHRAESVRGFYPARM